MQTFTDPHTDETFTFPVRLHPQLVTAARHYGLPTVLASIDEVATIVDSCDDLHEGIGECEQPIDDLYRLCLRIRNAWQAQYSR